MKYFCAFVGLFLIMVAIGSGIAVLTPRTSLASGNCPELGDSNCQEPCAYFDEPLTFCAENCSVGCVPFTQQREYYVAFKRCQGGVLCWVRSGCCIN